MRIAGLLLHLALCVAVAGGSGCKNKSTDASAAPDPAALKAQQELEAKRTALMEKRKKLQDERDKLDEQIKQVTATGGDTSELAKQRAALETQIEREGADLESLSTKLDQVVARGDAAAGIAAREASMSTREKQVAAREERFAERERALAQREAALAQREKETCSAVQPMVIQQVAAPKGGNYTRKDIEPLLGKARAQMARKGLQPPDLGPAANLEGEATRAMKDSDWGKAYLAAAQLVATVDAIKIDRGFITAKYSRLNNRVKSAKVDESTKQQLTEGMKEVLQKYGDGDFTAANKKLNQLNALVK